ncbi:MAG: hypothetical protein LBO62_00115, partial [Endomicrobium sp.]|nr:hypothetical protein [Endomicrobium sp.]
MFRPPLEEAQKYLKDYSVIPVYKEIFADVKTSVEILKNFLKENKKCFLLESVENGESWGRYSFLGCDPKLSASCRDGKVVIDDSKITEVQTEEPVKVLREILSKYKSPKFDFLPPFTGGFVGYFSYDYIKYVEKSLKLENRNAENFDDFSLMLFDKIIAVDHFKQKIFIIANAASDNFEINYEQAKKDIAELEKIIKSPSSDINFKSELKSDLRLLHNEEEFSAMIEKIKKHIF